MTEARRLSGRHITIMVVAVSAAAALAPVGVAAAGKQAPAVALADGSHASRLAAVSKSGALAVAPKGTTKIAGVVVTTPGGAIAPYSVSGQNTTINSVTVSVPSSGHVVLQSVSAYIGVADPVSQAGVDITYHQGGQAAHLYVPLTRVEPQAGVADAYFMTTVPVTLYPDPGTSIVGQGYFDSATLSIMKLTFSGYRA